MLAQNTFPAFLPRTFTLSHAQRSRLQLRMHAELNREDTGFVKSFLKDPISIQSTPSAVFLSLGREERGGKEILGALGSTRRKRNTQQCEAVHFNVCLSICAKQNQNPNQTLLYKTTFQPESSPSLLDADGSKP